MKYEASLLTGDYGAPQTRARLIVLATLNGLPPMDLPAPLHAKYNVDEKAIIDAFEESEVHS